METTEKEKEKEKDDGKKELTLRVHAPRAPEPRTFTWAKTMKVGDAARAAATAFGYSGGNPGFQLLGAAPRPLDSNKTLVAEHLKDGDELEITDTGGGV
jgi:allophanate hydrolase subunit 1